MSYMHNNNKYDVAEILLYSINNVGIAKELVAMAMSWWSLYICKIFSSFNAPVSILDDFFYGVKHEN